MDNTLTNIYRHSAFNSNDLETIIGAHKKKYFNKGEMLLKAGQYSNEYYCLSKGIVRSFAISNEGKEITTGFYSENQIVIEVASFFLKMPTKENIQVMTDCECWKIDSEAFHKLFNSISGFSEWGRSWMSGQLLESKLRSLSIITDSATDRYIELIRVNPNILLNVPLKYIASYLGVTENSLSRIRKEITQSEKM